MATNFPGSLDTSTQQPTIASSDEMDDSGKEHDVVHTNHSGAIIALETKLGTGDSNAVADAVLMGTGSGTSGWDTSPTFKGAVTVGVDDTGHDVKLFGATSGSYMLWDESADELILKNASRATLENDSASAILSIEAYHDTESTSSILQFLKADGSAASPALVDDDASLGRIDFYGYDGDSFSKGAEIKALVNGTPGDGDMPTELLFSTSADGSASPTQRYRIGPEGIHVFGYDHSTYLNIRQGAAGTTGQIRWTFNQDDTATYATMGMVYDNRATEGWKLDTGYPITIDGKGSTGSPIQFKSNGTAIAEFTADGEFVNSKMPAFRVSNTTGGGGYLIQGSSTGAGYIIFGTDAYDSSDSGTVGLFDNGNNYNTSTGIFTAPVTGYYLFTVTVFKHTNYDNDTSAYWGFNTSNGQIRSNHGVNGQDGGQTISAVMHLDANDTCGVYMFSALDIYTWRTENYNSFSGVLLG